MSKKILSVILTLVMCLSLVASLNVTVSAASLPTISKSKPLITYTYSSTGKVYAYKEASLKNKTGGYIACATDECKIIEINGEAVKVTYPVSGGTKTAWFSREAFTYRDLAKDGAQKSFTAQVGVTAYRWKNNYTKMGSVSKNDKCYLLRGKETSDWVQIIYPVTGGHKMAWVTGNDYCKMAGINPPAKNGLADVAQTQIGYQGTNSKGKGTGDYTKYGKWIGSNGTQWCASFVSWCVNQAGISTSIVPKTASCDHMEDYSNSYYKWSSNTFNNIKRNDVIFFAPTNNLSNSTHVGIVSKVDKSNKKISVIEGNTGPTYGPDIVKEITYTVDSKTGKITAGYGGYSFCGYISVN